VRFVVAPDPVDVRLLALVAEAGRIAVHDIATRTGLDVREIAARLAALAATGLPLVVGIECDPQGIRAALARMNAWGGYPATPSGPHQVHGTPSGTYQVHGTPSGTYNVHGTPSGPSPAYGTPSGSYPTHGGTPSGPYPAGHAPGVPQPQYPVHTGPASGPFPAQPNPPSGPFPAQPGPVTAQPTTGGHAPIDPMSTWGPPQSASWARGDRPPQTGMPGPATPTAPAAQRTGRVGGTLETIGLEGERLAIQLVEVVDPADFLFTAAGYRLEPGERSVVVHTEFTNRGAVPFSSLPDQYLVLVTKDGQTISKAPVSLSSRPPHRIGVQPGETAGGHTVYVLPEDVELVAVRWSPRPDDEQRTLTWSLAEN